MGNSTQKKSTKDEICQNLLTNIPRDLLCLKQWVVWRRVERDGKSTKVPYVSHQKNQKAAVNKPSTWGSIEKAIQAYKGGNFDGIGFVFTENDPFVGIDLDKCRNPETGVLDDWAERVIKRINSYTELSPSHTGVHILARATLPAFRRRRGLTEIYERGRYFCMTGIHLEDTPATINERQEEINAFHEEIFSKSCRPSSTKTSSTISVTARLNDHEVIEKAKLSRAGDIFTKLYQGNWDDSYPSQSEAELALCGYLTFYTGPNPDQIDRLFRKSGLIRGKWDRENSQGGPTYGQCTINKAIEGKTVFYKPEQEKIEGRANDKNEKPSSAILAEQYLDCRGQKLSDGLLLRWHNESWLKFNGRCHEEIPENELEADIMRFLRSGPVKKYANRSLLGNVLVHLMAICVLPSKFPLPCLVQEDQCHPRPNTVVLQNGLLDIDACLSEGSFIDLTPHSPHFISRVCLPFEFDPNAQCPMFFNFIEEILPDTDSRMLLQEIAGYSLTSDVSQQKFFLFYGDGGNGKSVLLNILTHLLGKENVSNLPLEAFSSPHGLEATIGKFLNIAADLGDIDQVAEGVLKQFTGGDAVYINPKFKRGFFATPTAKLIIACNVLPPFRDRSEGLWRRLIILLFPVSIPEEKRNPKLVEELISELPGIFVWALRGAISLRKRGRFFEPLVSKEVRETFKREANPARVFLEENYYFEPGCAEVETFMIYEKYVAHCQSNGFRPLNATHFGRVVRKIFPQVERARVGIGSVYTDSEDQVLIGKSGTTSRLNVYRGLRPIERDPF